MGYADRVKRVCKMMEKKGYDALFLTDPGSLAYVSEIFSFAWHGGDAIILKQNGEIYRVLSIAETGRHEIDGWIKNLIYWAPPFAGVKPKPFLDTVIQTINEVVGSSGVIGVELDFIRYIWMDELKKKLPNYSFENVTADLKHVMMLKDDEEVQLMRKLANFSEIGFQAALAEIKPGKMESEVAAAGDSAMFRAGASYVYTPSLSCADERVVWDHPPTERVIAKGDLVKVDFHPVYKEYRADYYNIISVGKPKDSLKRMSDAVAEATRDMLAAMKPGALSSDLDRIFRKKMALRGYEGMSNVYLGHGIGTTHLPPFISQFDTTVLEKNVVVILNPFCYDPMKEGVFMEYMALVTENGVELLNKGPLDLIVLDY